MKTRKQKTKKRRLVKGKDFDGWSWETPNGELYGFNLSPEVLASYWNQPSDDSYAVKVKLVKAQD